MIRPRPARWFEVLTARDDATMALEALATTGAVELESRQSAALPAALADVRPLLFEFVDLATRYHAYWPAERNASSAFPEAPVATLARGLVRLRAWAKDAEPVIQQIQRSDKEHVEILLWRRVLEAIGESTIDFARLANAGPVLHVRLVVFPPESRPEMPPGTLIRPLDLEGPMAGTSAALTVGNADDAKALVQQAALLKGRVYDAPRWLETNAAQTERHIAQRLDMLKGEQRRLAAELRSLHTRHGLQTALDDAHRLQWLLENVRALETGDLFCWITGWTSDFDGCGIGGALDRSGARTLLHFPPSAPKARPPLLFANPPWARPFEVFSRAMGMPSATEADPSTLLALVVPLMFGYMFGDVGQGLVVAALGFAVHRRFPIARLFIVGGVAAAVFGVLFGSVFSVHAMAALWIAPLAAPLTILAVPLAGGVVLLIVGLALNALEAWWRGDFASWLVTDAGLVVAYIGILSVLLDPRGFVAAGAGALFCCIGHAVRARRIAAAFVAAAEFFERLMQLLINTLSFVRVGAFALAHAGLSSAIVALMDAGESAALKALVLVVGNVIVLVLETMVVSIQTTRLVLFEFFTRFLTADGRIFRPLPSPPSTSPENAT